MHLEHLNLVVIDIERTLAFYQAAFPHWQIRGGGKSHWYGTDRQWIHFGDEHQYLTFNDNGYGENRPLNGNQLGMSHFAYVCNDLDGVISRLIAAGFDVDKEGTLTRFRKNVYFIDPNGFEVEFVQYLSDIPAERNLYE